MEKELRNLDNEKDMAELEIKSISKEQAKLKSKINDLQEQLQKKEDILYHSEFELAKLDRHNGKATGTELQQRSLKIFEEFSERVYYRSATCFNHPLHYRPKTCINSSLH